MSYIGTTELKASDIRRFDVTGSTSATHTLTWTAPTEQSLIVTLNGVKQQEDAYSVSGTTLTLTSALVATDKLEVIGINDIGTTITPAQGSVNADKLNTSGTASSSTFLRGDMAWTAVSDVSGLSSVQVFTSSGTWTRPTGITKVIMEVQGGGGHGGTSDSGTRTGGPGGGGAYAKKLLTGLSDGDTFTITIGAAAGVAASGTTTSVASASGTSFTTITCTGGAGGVTASGAFGAGGAGGAVPTTGDLNIKGQDGQTTESAALEMTGGNSMLGFGGQNAGSLTVAGAGSGYGSGGQGGRGATNAGAAGTPGIVIIWEYK